VDETKLPLTDHLAELRARIFRILIAWVIGAAVSWRFSERIFGLLLEPAVAALGGEDRQRRTKQCSEDKEGLQHPHGRALCSMWRADI